MSKQSPDAVYLGNLAVLAAVVELGAATLQKVLGSDATSTQVNGEVLTTRDLQDLIAARVAKAVGV